MIEKIEVLINIFNLIKEIKSHISSEQWEFRINLEFNSYLEFVKNKDTFIYLDHFYILDASKKYILLSDLSDTIFYLPINFDNINFPISDPLEFVLEHGRVDLSKIHILNLKSIFNNMKYLWNEYKRKTNE